MKKTRRSDAASPARPPAIDLELARQQLRDFSAFLESQDPELLAAEVTTINDTLKRSARIQSWFSHYVTALKARVVH